MTTYKTKHRGHSHDLYDDVAKIKAALMEATQDAKDQAAEIFSDSINNIKDKTVDVKESIEEYTEHKPFRSLGMALLAGALIGYLIKK